MAASVRELPGVRIGAHVFLFADEDEEGYSTRIEDLDADWVAVVSPDIREIGVMPRPGEPLEIEVPQPAGSLYLVGKMLERRTSEIPLLVVQVQEVGADAGVGTSKEARQHFRQSVWLPARLFAFRDSPRADWEEASAIVRNLSAGGAALLADRQVPIGAVVCLRCAVPLDPVGITVYGQVVGCRPSGTPNRPRYSVNVQFGEMEKSERGWLVQQLYRYQWLARWRR